MLLALPLMFTACSNDDEEEDIPLAGPLSCFLESEISFYNADGTACDLEPYADDLYASEMTFSIMLDSSGVAKEYVEDMCLDEKTDSIVGDKMYVEMAYLGTLNTIAPNSDATFYLKMRSAKMFGNEDEHLLVVSGVLKFDTAAQRTDVVTDMEATGGPVAGKNDFFLRHCL